MISADEASTALQNDETKVSDNKSRCNQVHKAFENTLEPERFFQSSTHVEALSRMLFLVEENRHCATLTGAAGIGKTLLLRVAARELRRSQRLVVSVDLACLDKTELLWRLAAGMRLAPKDGESTGRLWRMLEDYLTGLRHSGLQRAFLFDNADRAGEGCLPAIERVMQIDSSEGRGTTAILAGRSFDPKALRVPLVEMCDLKIEVDALTALETSRYVTSRLAAVKCDENLFEDTAMDAIFKNTSGVPRDINRLCELSLMAAMHLGRETVDQTSVSGAAQELRQVDDSESGIPLLFESA